MQVRVPAMQLVWYLGLTYLETISYLCLILMSLSLRYLNRNSYLCLFSVRPSMPETTALGAAMAAGMAVGVWSVSSEDETTITTDTFFPTIGASARDHRFGRWKNAVQRSMHWEMTSTQIGNFILTIKHHC